MGAPTNSDLQKQPISVVNLSGGLPGYARDKFQADCMTEITFLATTHEFCIKAKPSWVENLVADQFVWQWVILGWHLSFTFYYVIIM